MSTTTSPVRTAGVVVGALLLLIGLGGAGTGGGLLWLEGQRDSAGYVAIPAQRYADDGYALRFDADDLAPVDRDWPWIGEVLGDVRIRVSVVDSGPLFAGIARTSDVARYLDGVPHRRFNDYRHMAGTTPMALTRPPGGTGIWVDSASGTGTLTLDWTPRPGDWSLVVMNTGAQPGTRADIAFAATAPALQPAAIGVLSGGIVFLLGGALFVALAARPRRHR